MILANSKSTLDYEIAYPGGILKLNRTILMGILNVTPDSFADGGKFYEQGKAIAHGIRMLDEGADIIDVGGESTRPGAEPVPLEQELKRVIPVIKGIKQQQPDALISVDTYKARVAEAALKAGVSMVNDISGLDFDPEVVKIVSRAECPLIIMHIKGTPRHMQDNPQYNNLIPEIIDYFQERIKRALAVGINKNQIIIDPGIGFGKRLEHNYEILDRLSEFKILGYPILVGPSRKSFIGRVLNRPVEERLCGTAAAVAVAVIKGAQIIRVHDVKEMQQVVKICDSIKQWKLLDQL